MQVGSLIICEKDNGGCMANLSRYGNAIPEIGKVYELREFVADSNCSEIECLRLVEIINPAMDFIGGVQECAFQKVNFREVQPPMDLTELLKETEPQTVLVTR